MDKRPEWKLLQRGHTDGQQTHEKMFNVPNIRGMQMKTTMRYHVTSVRMAMIHKSMNNKVRRRCGKRGTLWWE